MADEAERTARRIAELTLAAHLRDPLETELLAQAREVARLSGRMRQLAEDLER